MPIAPRDTAIDSTLALWREGYRFIWNRCRRLKSDVFEARVMGERTLCIHGREAAELFYDTSRFERSGAVPRRGVTSLFGKKAVHTLDGDAHRARKDAFLSLMAPHSLERLMEFTEVEWERAITRWKGQEKVVLFDEAALVLTRATCAWAGLLLGSEGVEAPRRARELVSMVDGFGGAGPRLWLGKLSRVSTNAWAARAIERVRHASVAPPPAIGVMAHLTDASGRLLPPELAGIELLNVIRPAVAVAWYIAFAAHALERYPAIRERLSSAGDADDYRDLFAQEVRRFYPFAPYLGAKVKVPFEWRGVRFEPGTSVLLDVYGMQHDPAIWGDPEEFRPERFRDRHPDAFDFIPQGGGPPGGHRCPGEWITTHSIALAVDVLTRRIRFTTTPGQDLSFDLSRMPTRPRSGFVFQNVRDAEPQADEPFVPSFVLGTRGEPRTLRSRPRSLI